jgi:hypothetical protein
MTSNSAVAVRQTQAIKAQPHLEMVEIDDARRRLWNQFFFEGATPADIEFCIAFCQHRELDPIRGEVFFSKFKKKDGTYTVTPIVTAIGYRVLAERTGDYLGQTPRQWCGTDGVWKEVWLDAKNPPAAARVGILKRGCPQPIYAVAVFHRFVKTWDGQPTGLWKSNPDVMIATRAETAAFKLAFPETRREEQRPGRGAIREVRAGTHLRSIEGAIADDDGGDVFEALPEGEALAERERWQEESQALHGLVQRMHPDESNVHSVVHDIVCEHFGVDSTREVSADQLRAFRQNLEDETEFDDDEGVIEVEAKSVNAPAVATNVDVDEKTISTWTRNIKRASSEDRLGDIEKLLRENGLISHPAIAAEVEAKHWELNPDL